MRLTKGNVTGIISIKGGVGKTTAVLNLAHVLANDYGKKVLVIDGNLSSPHISLHLGHVDHKVTLQDVLNKKAKLQDAIYEHELGFHVMPSSTTGINSSKTNLREVTNQLKNHYDHIILDSSPSLDAEIYSTINAADDLYVISTPDIPTLTTTIKAINVARTKKAEVKGLILNKVRGRDYEIKASDMERLTGLPLVGVIKDNVKVLEALHKVQPITKLSPLSNVSLEYKRIAARMLNVPFKEPRWDKKALAYLKDDFSNLTEHRFTAGLRYYQ